MNEHYMQKRAKQVIGMIGYFLGPIIFIAGIILAFQIKGQEINFSLLSCLGLCVFYLSDLTISSQGRMEILLRILKRQETLFRKEQKQNIPDFSPDPFGFFKHTSTTNPGFLSTGIFMDEDGNVITKGDKLPDDIQDATFKGLNIDPSKVNEKKEKTASEKEKEDTEVDKYRKMSLKSLDKLLSQAIEQQDYEKAAIIRDVVKDKKNKK